MLSFIWVTLQAIANAPYLGFYVVHCGKKMCKLFVAAPYLECYLRNGFVGKIVPYLGIY